MPRIDEFQPERALWTPERSARPTPRVTLFQQYLADTRGVQFDDYRGLWAWSTAHIDEFWEAVWDYFGLDTYSARGRAIDDTPMPRATWFPGTHLNFAQYVLDQGADDDIAIIGLNETGLRDTVTRQHLRADVDALARRLTALGVSAGDVVVGYLPHVSETVVAFLAAARIGAIWSSVGQDYSAPAVVDRFGQLEPKVLVAADGYVFNGKRFPRTDEIAHIRAALPSVRHTMVVEMGHGDVPTGCESWQQALAVGRASPALVPRATGFNDPLWVLFSSGTTGLPKGLVHGHGGILLETLKAMALHWDLAAEDRVLWYTSPSWVMWNLLASTLAVGASIVCYDGSPTAPDEATLWRSIETHQVTYFGASPAFLQLCRDAGLEPGRQFDLSTLRSMGTTGSPLPRDVHRWATHAIGDIPLWSISGGTDVAAAFVGGVPTVPVWPGELSAPCLGVAVEAWDGEGRPVVDQVGEMVITRPMPSMPLRLWGDPDFERYSATYFEPFPNAWRQGDWITITSRGSVVIHGRSDSTLNRHGVRMGSADIYAAVEAIPEIAESLVLGVEGEDGDYWMPLFVTLRAPGGLDDALIDRIRSAIRIQASPRHVPDEILEVAGLPHTRTGKRLEVPLKRILQGADPARAVNPATVDEPRFLDYFIGLARERNRQP